MATVPKVELQVHLNGSIAESTARALARRHGADPDSLVRDQVPLVVCPTSNVAMGVVPVPRRPPGGGLLACRREHVDLGRRPPLLPGHAERRAGQGGRACRPVARGPGRAPAARGTQLLASPTVKDELLATIDAWAAGD